MIETLNKDEHWGIHLVMDLFNCDEKIIRSAALVEVFVQELCKEIKMQPYGKLWLEDFGDDPAVHGITFFQAIQTSSITGHFVNDENSAYIDIFTCKAFDVTKAAVFVSQYFKAKQYSARKLHRHKYFEEK